jgi:hypothetical protein
MGAFKQFLAADITVVPFEVNKAFSYKGVELDASDVSINRFLGTNLSGSLFNPDTDPTTGQTSIEYQRLIYSSIQELYYSNHLSSSYNDPAVTASLVPGTNTEGDRFIGPAQSDGRYFNYNQTTLTFEKIFPTGSGSQIGVLSVPSRLYGNYIVPNSFIWNSDGILINDDGEGNLINSNTGFICGQIFYPHGLAIITEGILGEDGYGYGYGLYGSLVYGSGSVEGYGYGTYGSLIYGSGSNLTIEDFIASSNVTCSFSSSLNIYESQYKCTISENEFNFSLNPSALSGSTDGAVYDFVTSSYFAPYVTTVGLYDENQNLLAIGKLSQPLPTSPTTDTTILINIDR